MIVYYQEFLCYGGNVKEDNPENNTKTEDAYVKELQQSIHSVKENRKLENSFMSLEEIREAGRLEGKREDVIELLEELGEIPLSLKERIMSETDAATLKSMLKAASSAVSYADFEEKMKSL
ncbi:MAG: hypothetical protein IJD81_03745 [Oscillospiraceae bacterium]|nr:hypothetical protein [Oscillospiraceae bacterium]